MSLAGVFVSLAGLYVSLAGLFSWLGCQYSYIEECFQVAFKRYRTGCWNTEMTVSFAWISLSLAGVIVASAGQSVSVGWTAFSKGDGAVSFHWATV